MESVLVPPGVTEIEREVAPAVDPEALIEEARQRQRSRRRRGVAVALAVVAVGALAFGIVRLVSRGNARGAGETPKGLFVDRSPFAGHGVLAFVSRGRLFVLDGSTQKLTAVTSVAARASDPRFSPNGRWLAYTLGTGRLGLARADGSDARVFLSNGGASWLPGGELLLRSGLFHVAANGSLVRVGSAPRGLVAWSPDGDRFVFVSRAIVRGRDGAFQGVERLQIADSPTGKRTTWRGVPFSFTRKLGFQGNVTANVRVLPHREGILFWVDPDQSNSYAADGLSVYEVKAPVAMAIRLAVTVGDTVSIGPDGRFAIGAGGNRYAWITKYVVTCDAATAQCTNAPTRPGRLTIDPAWSPDGKTLAYVEAAAQPESDSRQATIEHWYATHTLWLLRPGTAHTTEVAGTQGAASPVWSSDGTSLLYVAGDALWLIPKMGAKPEKIAAPLYPPNAWPSYYGQVGWTNLFAWASPIGQD
jgi:dipeptidyl aminopeptidase/acylaminoacyl peptidase